MELPIIIDHPLALNNAFSIIWQNFSLCRALSTHQVFKIIDFHRETGTYAQINLEHSLRWDSILITMLCLATDLHLFLICSILDLCKLAQRLSLLMRCEGAQSIINIRSLNISRVCQHVNKGDCSATKSLNRAILYSNCTRTSCHFTSTYSTQDTQLRHEIW